MGDIWLMDTISGERKNLTNTPERDEVSPLWVAGQPDTLLFGSDTATGMENSSYPTIVNLDGSGYQILDEVNGGLGSISPDGSQFFYSAYQPTALIYDWDSGAQVFDPLAYGLHVKALLPPVWSPDGSKIAAFASGDPSNPNVAKLGIAIFDLEMKTAQLHHVYEPLGGGGFSFALQWSPDGEWLAFNTFNEPPAAGRAPNLWVMRPDGSDERYIAEGAAPVWRYDSQYLAFQALNEAQTEEVFLVSTETWEVKHIEDLSLPERILFLWDWVIP